MQGLVETDPATARQWNRRDAIPRRRLHSGAVNIPAVQEFDLCLPVVTHRVRHGTQQSLSRRPLGKLTRQRLNARCRRRHGKAEPACSNGDRAGSKDAAERRGPASGSLPSTRKCEPIVMAQSISRDERPV